MLSGFCCYCFMLLYKIRKTFGYVFLGCSCRFLRTLLLFSLDVVACFPDIAVVSLGFCRFCFMLLYKTFRNLYKTEYFLYKKRRKFQHVFSDFLVFSYSDPGFFCFFLLTFSEEKSVFLTRLSVNDRIYSYQPYVFHAFFGRLDRFLVSSCFFSCIFLLSAGKKSSVVLSSGSSVFEIFSLHRDIFCPVLRNFFIPFPFFQCFS